MPHFLRTLRHSLLLLGYFTAACPYADDRIIIEAKLNGQPLKLAFDTGAGELLVFHRIAEQRNLQILPPPSDIQPKPGEVVVSHTEPLKFELLGHIFPDIRAGVIDAPSGLRLDIDGVLGWQNVRSNIWSFSLSTSQTDILASVPTEALKWLKLREINDPQRLILELPQTQSTTPLYFGVDTGSASGVRLSSEAWDRWRGANPKQSITLDAYFMPGAGLVIAENIWADEIDIGALTLRGVPVARMNAMESLRFPPGTVAVLGIAAMRRVDMVIDGKNGIAYAHPLITPPQPYNHNRLGAVFVPSDLENGTELVAHVAENSPAAKAGVRDGDVLLKIDQLDVTPWRTQPGILPLAHFWEQTPGTRLHLTIKRGTETLTVDAVLQNILGPTPK